MKSNIRNALSIPETSIIVEGAHRSIEYAYPYWYREFQMKLRYENHSIYRLVGCIINDARYPRGRGRDYEYWKRISLMEYL